MLEEKGLHEIRTTIITTQTTTYKSTHIYLIFIKLDFCHVLEIEAENTKSQIEMFRFF